MTFEEVRAIAVELPGAVEAAAHGTRSFTVRKKLFLRLMEDGETLLLRSDPYERDHLLATAPAVFHLTDEIREHPWVLVRLAGAAPAQLRPLVHDAWRRRAPRRLVEEFGATMDPSVAAGLGGNRWRSEAATLGMTLLAHESQAATHPIERGEGDAREQ